MPFIAPPTPNDMIFPEITNVVDGFVFPIPNLLLELPYVQLDDCKIDDVPFPMNIRFADNVVVPIPPLEIDNVPDGALLT